MLTVRRSIAWLVAACVLGCGAADDPSPNRSDPPETDQLFWLSPARCLAPCNYLPEKHLVRIDDDGAIAEEGRHRFAADAQPALQALLAAARSEGRAISADSGFRSYERQVELYLGAAEIGRTARPGHSEHQIGTTMDFAYAEESDAAWLAERAPEFGFALSYPNHKQKVTGFRYEPWHLRYVGNEPAREIAERGWAIEEYFRAHPERTISGDCRDCPHPASLAPCDGVTPEGECAGSVLGFCMDGWLARVDCATSGLACETDGRAADCR
jgi:hypothetical protein